MIPKFPIKLLDKAITRDRIGNEKEFLPGITKGLQNTDLSSLLFD